MNKYNYLDEIVNDIKLWASDNKFNLSDFVDREQAREYLESELWDDDTITGNGLEGYNSEEKCEEYLCHNLDLLMQAIEEFDVFRDPFQLRSYIDNHRFARYLDCSIRCFLLGEAIEQILDWLENLKFKYMGE